MSYRIDPDRPIRKNLRRLARRQLDGALAALAEPGDLGLEGTVHEVRKRCKKVRGLIRLVRPGLGDEYRRANAEVRDAARELSPLRDAHAMLGTLDDLIAATHGDRLPGDGLGRVREALVLRAGEAERADAGAPLERAGERLARVRRRVHRWAPDDDVAIVLSGLTDNHRRARRAFRHTLHHPTDEALHEWRKRAKYGWHHVTLLHAVAPSALGPLGRERPVGEIADLARQPADRPAVVADLLAEGAGV